MCSEDGNKVPVTKLRIKFGPDCWVKTFQIKDPKKFEDEFFSSKKRRAQDIEKVGTKKKQKCDLSSQCLRLLMDHQFGWLFTEPVDSAKLNIPDYLTVVSKPMDLGTVQSKLLRNSYKSSDEFAADVRSVFTNAMLYHSSDNLIHKAAKQLKETFEVRWKKALETEADCSASGRFCAELPKPVLKDDPVLVKPVKVQKSTKVVKPKEILEVGLKKSVARGSIKRAITVDCSASRRFSEEFTKKVPEDGYVMLKQVKGQKTSLDTPQEKALRATILKGQFAETIVRAKHKKVHDQQSNKPDLVSIQIEKEQMEKRQCQERARIEAEMRAARIAKRKAELKEMRDRERAELESMVIGYDLDEKYNFGKVHMDWVQLCGSSYMTRNVLPKLGLVLRNDDHLEVDDLEEGEII